MKEEKLLRSARLLGTDNVRNLGDRFIVIVGTGAVGGYCLEALARIGIGHFRLVDFDCVELSNINRQILATESTVGLPKVQVAADRIKDIESTTEVEQLFLFADTDTFAQVFAPGSNGRTVDLVIDAIDSVSAKCRLLQYAYEHNVPIVSSMGAALRKDPSLIRTADIMDSFGCPLAKAVRSNLRKAGVGRGIECVFSPEQVEPMKDAPGQENACSTTGPLGSLPTITGIFGLTLAHLALKTLLPEGLL